MGMQVKMYRGVESKNLKQKKMLSRIY